jgi:hypothetical protein
MYLGVQIGIHTQGDAVITLHSARITGPVTYADAGGMTGKIPVGPCLLEYLDGQSVEVVWGNCGENCAHLARQEFQSAKDVGCLVMLD